MPACATTAVYAASPPAVGISGFDCEWLWQQRRTLHSEGLGDGLHDRAPQGLTVVYGRHTMHA
jgi:hypothetical protein